MDKQTRTPAEVLAGTPINEPGVVYFYKADDMNSVYIQITNQETLDAVREAKGLAIRKFYTFSPEHLAQLGSAPLATVAAAAAAAAKLAELQRRGEELIPSDYWPLVDALYTRGYQDARDERDWDPRGTEEWQAVIDAIDAKKGQS